MRSLPNLGCRKPASARASRPPSRPSTPTTIVLNIVVPPLWGEAARCPSGHPGGARCKQRRRRLAHEDLRCELDQTVRVAPLVVVPRHGLDLRAIDDAG